MLGSIILEVIFRFLCMHHFRKRRRGTPEIVRMVWKEKALVRIGKKGITDEVIDEIKRQLKNRGIIKVRILKAAITKEGKDRYEIAKLLAERVGAKLVGVRGYAIVLYKPRGRIIG